MDLRLSLPLLPAGLIVIASLAALAGHPIHASAQPRAPELPAEASLFAHEGALVAIGSRVFRRATLRDGVAVDSPPFAAHGPERRGLWFGRVVAATQTGVAAFDPGTARELWRVEPLALEGECFAVSIAAPDAATIAVHLSCFGADGGVLVGLAATDGAVLWRREVGLVSLAGGGEGRLFVADHDGTIEPSRRRDRLVALAAADGRVLWTGPAGHGNDHAIAAGGRVVVGGPHALRILDADTGRSRGPTRRVAVEALALDADVAYAVLSRTRRARPEASLSLVAVSVRSGRALWSTEIGRSLAWVELASWPSVLAPPGSAHVFAWTSDGILRAYARASGGVRGAWHLGLPRTFAVLPAAPGTSVVVAQSVHEEVTAFDPDAPPSAAAEIVVTGVVRSGGVVVPRAQVRVADVVVTTDERGVYSARVSARGVVMIDVRHPHQRPMCDPWATGGARVRLEGAAGTSITQDVETTPSCTCSM